MHATIRCSQPTADPRQIVPLCVMCHAPQSADPGSNNTIDLEVMIHKIHMLLEFAQAYRGSMYCFGDSSFWGDNFSTVCLSILRPLVMVAAVPRTRCHPVQYV